MVIWFYFQVRVSMLEQEALLSEKTTLKEVIKHLKEQQSARESTLEYERTPLPVSEDMLLTTDECQESTERRGFV